MISHDNGTHKAPDICKILEAENAVCKRRKEVPGEYTHGKDAT